jgi:integrase
MLDLAVRHGAIESNPMNIVAPTGRAARAGRGVTFLTVERAVHLRHVVRRDVQRVPGRRMPNRDLEEWVDFVLGTGCRDGEVLAVRWRDVCLDVPTIHVCGTVVEPRGDLVPFLVRQPRTKSRVERTLLLPEHVASMLAARRARSSFTGPEDPVFATSRGTLISPANVRTRLRRAVQDDDLLRGASPHLLRRSVGTLIAHEAGLDAAREQLGHSDPSVTFQHYVGRRAVAPDLRRVLDSFFAELPALPTAPLGP